MTTPTLRAILEAIAQYPLASGQEMSAENMREMARAALAAQPELPEPFGIWHEADDPSECDFFLFSESGDVSCERCVKLYTADQLQQANTESVLIDGTAYDIPAPVAAELLRLNIELKQAQANVTTDAAQITREFDELLGDYWDEAYEQGEEGRTHDDADGTAQKILSGLQALFAHALQTQAKREPMTDLEIQELGLDIPHTPVRGRLLRFARAIEAHHNIGDKA